MVQARGYATWTAPDRPLVERDTVQCCHCGRGIFVKPGTKSTVYLIWSDRAQRWLEEPGCGCYLCGYQPVCLACHADGRCVPLERRLAQMENGR